MTPNRFDRDREELGWRAAMSLWLENRDSAPRIIGWTDPIRVTSLNTQVFAPPHAV